MINSLILDVISLSFWTISPTMMNVSQNTFVIMNSIIFLIMLGVGGYAGYYLVIMYKGAYRNKLMTLNCGLGILIILSFILVAPVF